jgi:hypothetical protein
MSYSKKAHVLRYDVTPIGGVKEKGVLALQAFESIQLARIHEDTRNS